MPQRVSRASGRPRYAGIGAALTVLLAAQAPVRAEPRLERVVLVARHGVRSPTAGPAALEAMTGPGRLSPPSRAR